MRWNWKKKKKPRYLFLWFLSNRPILRNTSKINHLKSIPIKFQLSTTKLQNHTLKWIFSLQINLVLLPKWNHYQLVFNFGFCLHGSALSLTCSWWLHNHSHLHHPPTALASPTHYSTCTTSLFLYQFFFLFNEPSRFSVELVHISSCYFVFLKSIFFCIPCPLPPVGGGHE